MKHVTAEQLGAALHVLENTLCGIAQDAADSEGDESMRWIETAARVVTCPECSRVVLACRGLRVGA